jgi:molecular chaperone DnaK
MASENKLLGQFDLVGIPPAPRGVPQIEVTFDIDANGIMNVSAVDKAANKKQTITIQSSGGLSQQEVETMIKEAETYREQDNKKKETAMIKNEAEALQYTVETQIQDLQDKMTAEQKTELEEKLKNLQNVLSTDDGEKIKAAMNDLQECSWKISSAAYTTQVNIPIYFLIYLKV